MLTREERKTKPLFGGVFLKGGFEVNKRQLKLGFLETHKIPA